MKRQQHNPFSSLEVLGRASELRRAELGVTVARAARRRRRRIGWPTRLLATFVTPASEMRERSPPARAV